MPSHTVSYYPDVFVLVNQKRILIFGPDVSDIGHAVAENLETDRGLLSGLCGVARQCNSLVITGYSGSYTNNSKLIGKWYV